MSARILCLLRGKAPKWSSTLQSHAALSTSSVRHAQPDYAYEMACSNIRYGEGVTQEIGMDCKNMGATNVCVVTDARLAKMDAVKTALESLERNGVKYQLYDKTRVEPSEQSFKECIQFAKDGGFDMFVAVGGGSVMDTAKAANLYSSNPSADFMDYVNAPLGKGLPITHTVRPLIAVTTTAGTGSETTGTAVFDFTSMRAKTGISNRALRPTLGLLDPLHLRTTPERVTAYTGLDVLCHAIESFTALPFNQRVPRPENPNLRPAYQGNNPISDVWCQQALSMTATYIKRATYNAGDMEARSQMLLASCFAGIGFGNGGCHLPHAMSYPISGLVKKYTADGYESDHPMIPHGLSVIVTSPAVFSFTAQACPERHLRAAQCLGGDITNVRKEDAGRALSDVLRGIMQSVGVPNGLQALGYTSDDIPDLVKGTMPQHRLTKLSPRPADEDAIAGILEASMTIY